MSTVHTSLAINTIRNPFVLHFASFADAALMSLAKRFSNLWLMALNWLTLAAAKLFNNLALKKRSQEVPFG